MRRSRLVWTYTTAGGMFSQLRVQRRETDCEIARPEVEVSSSDLVSKEWVAVRVKSNFEQYVASSVRGKNLEQFYPTFIRKKEEEGREVRAALFPGYLFCRLHMEERLPVLKIPGVVGFVGIGKQPLPIPEQEILSIQRMLESRLPVWPHPFLRVGQQVRLKAGPLRGIEGSILSIAGDWRIVVAVTLLQRAVTVSVKRDWIGPL